MKNKFLQSKRALYSVLYFLLLAMTLEVNAQDTINNMLLIEADSIEMFELPDRGGKPIVTTLAATNITANSATLRATINPNGYNVAYLFNYGTNTSYSNNSEPGTLNSGNSTVTVSIVVSGLLSNTTYHFRIMAGNDKGLSYGSDKTFTTLTSGNSAPNIPSNPNPSNGSTGIATSRTFSWTCTDPDGDDVGYDLFLGSSLSNMSLRISGYGTSAYISGLNEGQKYYWRIIAYDDYDAPVTGPIWDFTTISNSNAPPTEPSNPSPSNGATGVSTSPALSWSCYDPEGGTVGYDVHYGTSPTSQPYIKSGLGTSTILNGLNSNQTYYWKVVAFDEQDESTIGPLWHFTTGAADCFDDCTSSSCGDYGSEMYEAAQYLCDLDIVEGINYNLDPDIPITRAQLAKVALYSLYNGPSHVPNLLVTDYFPSIYPDLQDNATYYYKAAKALLYLEYRDADDDTQLDGKSPFDRDRSCFDPNGNIERCLVLKVLLETFNIKPLSSGTNVFDDYGPSGYSSSNFWGYAQKAYNLGIVQTTHFCPTDYCTRGEAFLYLYRILTNSSITKPTPMNTESPATSDFFIPANLSPEVVNAMRGVEYGNFNYYNKDFFNIPGYMNLDFGVSYNSYLTEMPDDFYPVKPLGKAWTHTYDMYMNIVTDAYNNSSYYVFHMQNGSLLIYDNNLSSVTEGNYYELTTSGSNKYILKSKGQISYTFERQSISDSIYYLTQIKDRNNNTIDINIENGIDHYRIQSVTTQGRTLIFNYKSGTDLVNYVKDPINRMVYFYYTDGQLTSLKDAKNQTTSFTYGTMEFEKGLLKSIQLPKGNLVYNNYQQRKLVSMRRVNNSNDFTHTAISITPNYQDGSTTSTVTTTGSQNVTTTYTMNNKNRITRMISGSHTDVSYEYNISEKPDLVSKITDNKTNMQTTYDYNNKGLPTIITVFAGGESHTTSTTYTNLNDVETFTDANGNTTSYYYDNGSVNLTRIVDAMGNTTNIINNSYGKPTHVTDPSGVSINYHYNGYGNADQITIPSLNKTNIYNYDGVSRVESQTDYAGHTTSYTYDDNDNILTETDALGNTTIWHFDANDNVEWIQNPLGKKTFMTYDDNDFLTQVSFEGATKSYSYNRDGSISTYTDPNGYTFNYSYSNSGEMISDGISTLGYNSQGQLESVAKDGKVITYVYDAFGRTASITYDGKTVGYTYDNNGNVKTIIYPGNKVVTYTYDALNRIKIVKDWNNSATNYYYRNDGQLNYFQYPNGVRTTYSYDASGRCNGFSTKRNNGSGTVIAEYSFGFDDIGNHTSEIFTEPYDTYPSIPTANITYNYNTANRLNSAGELSFGYDNNGNTIYRTGRTYDYDANNNLTSVSGDFTASYTYDGLNNRCSATRNGTTTKYVLNLLSRMPMVLMETDANGSAQNYYIYGPTGLISRIDANNNTRYYVYDYRGSTVAMTDDTSLANITHKYQYDDFGKLLQVEEDDENSYRYVGKYGVMYEDEALTCMRARYYDPEVGRFLSEDPIWCTSLYPYANNNPINGIDPSGAITWTPELGNKLNDDYEIIDNGYKIIKDGLDIFGVSNAIGSTITLFGDCLAVQSSSALAAGSFGSAAALHTASHALIVAGPYVAVGAVCVGAAAIGYGIGSYVGDLFDEEITNGMAKLIYNIKYKKKQEKQASGIKAAQSKRNAPKPIQWNQEAVGFIFNSKYAPIGFKNYWNY